MNYYKYKSGLLNRFKGYRAKLFSQQDELFDERWNHVFKSRYAENNLFNPELSKLLPKQRRHRWFGNMGSSQALAISVFGTMMCRGDLLILNEVLDDGGSPLMPDFVMTGKPEFDYKATTLNEPRPTQVDLFLPGQDCNVAIECKLWESELGSCSKVPKACDGCYSFQPGRAPKQRCALTEKGISYWGYIPQISLWRADVDHRSCPIWKPYQLVRNVLAAAIDPASQQVLRNSVTVLVYDVRNPAFTSGRKVDEQFKHVQAALHRPATLKRTTWQAIVATLKEKGGYEDLQAWLDEKYGIRPLKVVSSIHRN